MRTWISNQDLKTLAQGVSAVAACGLLLGSAMHPELDVGDKPGGPQILLAGGGPRGAPAQSDPGLGAYPYGTPEYVTGTDWTRPAPTFVDNGPIETAESVPVYDEEPSPVGVHRTVWRDEPRGPVVYPSQTGNADYEDNLPEPPPEPDDTDLGFDAG
jgi:hypothetical protein